MADFNVLGLDELMEALDKLAGEADTFGVKAIDATTPIIKEELVKECEKHKKSGDMADSIKATKAKVTEKGIYAIVRPTGTDKKGVRNMEKLAYLEYGTIKQAEKPVCRPVIERIEEKAAESVKKEFLKGVENAGF